MIIFIDTNIYLSYFKMQSGVLATLKKMEKFLNGNKKATLILPRQVKDEFLRNRNNQIHITLKQFPNFDNLNLGYSFEYAPKEIQETAKNIGRTIKDLKKNVEDLKAKAKKDFLDRNSEINTTIKSLFDLATPIEEDEEIFNLAHKRILKGNPPGKKGSLGDAIIWETILKRYRNESVYIIADDCDWYDETDETQLKPFLIDEWERIKDAGKIHFFKHVGLFLEKVTNISVPKEIIEQEMLLPPIYTFAPSAEVIGTFNTIRNLEVTLGAQFQYPTAIERAFNFEASKFNTNWYTQLLNGANLDTSALKAFKTYQLDDKDKKE